MKNLSKIIFISVELEFVDSYEVGKEIELIDGKTEIKTIELDENNQYVEIVCENSMRRIIFLDPGRYSYIEVTPIIKEIDLEILNLN